MGWDGGINVDARLTRRSKNYSWGYGYSILTTKTSRVPNSSLASIRSITFTIYGRTYHTPHTSRDIEYILGHSTDISNLHKMMKSFVRYFTTLEHVKFIYQTKGPYYESHDAKRRVLGEHAVIALKGVLERLVSGVKSLKQVVVFDGVVNVPLGEAARRILGEREEMRGILIVEGNTEK